MGRARRVCWLIIKISPKSLKRNRLVKLMNTSVSIGFWLKQNLPKVFLSWPLLNSLSFTPKKSPLITHQKSYQSNWIKFAMWLLIIILRSPSSRNGIPVSTLKINKFGKIPSCPWSNTSSTKCRKKPKNNSIVPKICQKKTANVLKNPQLQTFWPLLRPKNNRKTHSITWPWALHKSIL